MAKVFLDANYVIDILQQRDPGKTVQALQEGHMLFISALSWHIYCYIAKVKLPNRAVTLQRGEFQIMDFSVPILEKALGGPTSDFEDNVQLHSAVEADCDFFLTSDKSLLKMGYFGRVKIASRLQ